jgi:type I restriction enzyme M protein
MPRTTIDNLIQLGINRQLIEVNDINIKYHIQNKEYNQDPEEFVRAAVYVELVETYHYSPYRIDIEVQVPRRTPNDFADIVVFEDDTKLCNYIVVENKEANCSGPDFTQGIEQGFGNANSLRAKYLVVDNFIQRNIYDVHNFPANERDANRIADIPENYGLTPTYRIINNVRNGLKKVAFSDLAKAFQRCHNKLWSGGKLDPASAFDEMSKLLFAKIQDERTTPNGRHYKFQVGTNENEVVVAQRCLGLYDEARQIDPNVFTEAITVSDAKIKEVVEILQDISLTETDLDAKGQAFEKFLGVVFRGELGQYFTRRQIIEFIVDILQPNENDVILDPSCGSGGFLLYSMKKVTEKIRNDYKGNQRLIDRKVYDFSRQRIYGIEINSKIARVAMMDMIVNEDGHTNIESNTGLNSVFTNPNIGPNRFTLIMTNPPFGVKIKRDDRDNMGQTNFNNFVFGGDKKSQISDILFLEQYKRLLINDHTRNPRAGIVLQVGVLNNPSNKKLLTWLRLNFAILGVVNLPDFAFRKAGSGMKTCLLFIRKYQTPYQQLENIPDYDVFFAVAEHIGYDSTLRADTNDLPNIYTHYMNHTEDRAEGIFWLRFSNLEYRLDPIYYRNQHFISQHFERLRASGHTIIALEQLLSDLNAGKSPEGGVTRSTGEIPSITISNITKDGNLDFSSDLNFVPDEFFNEFNNSKGGLEYQDILIAKDGATTGKTAIIDDNFVFLDKTQVPPVPRAIFSEHVFRLRMKPRINQLFIHAFLNSELGQLQLETIISGGAQGGITRDFTKDIYVPIINEQSQKDIADFWSNGIQESSKLKTSYEESITNTKHQVDNMIEKAQPLPDDILAEILEIEEHIEGEENPEEEQ